MEIRGINMNDNIIVVMLKKQEQQRKAQAANCTWGCQIEID